MQGNKIIKLDLFFTFLKIGAFTFGGGYAMIPLIKRDIVENKRWISEEEMLDVIAVAESTPGPLAVNAATFVGTHIAGKTGALVATAGVTLPSFLIILILSAVISQVENMKIIKNAFIGIRAGVLVLIINAFFSVLRQLKKNVFQYTLMVLAFCAVAVFHISAIVTLLASAVFGIGYMLMESGGQ